MKDIDEILINRTKTLIKENTDEGNKHLGIANKKFELVSIYEKSLEILLKDVDNTDDSLHEEITLMKSSKNPTPPVVIQTDKATAKSIMKDLLKHEQVLLSGNALRDHYNKVTSKNLSKESFSPTLSNATKGENAIIKKHELEGEPIETRFVYGLTEWFENGKLKEEYLNKLKI